MLSKQKTESMMDLVVPIHGQLAMNMVFFDYLSRNTFHPFSLIVVDNYSQDQSIDFFEEMKDKGHNVQILRNPSNQCYPVSINQGARAGKSPIIGFLNNDIIVGPGWDRALVEALEKDFPVVSPTGIEHFPDRKTGDKLYQRWRYINRKRWAQDPIENLKRKISVMYWDFENFSSLVQEKYNNLIFDGIMGHCHLLSRNFFDKLGGLDPRMQGADWDLYLTVAKLRKEGKVENNPVILGRSYVHHFIRTTELNAKRMPVICSHEPHLKVEEKWTVEEICDLWPFDFEVPGYRMNFLDKMRKKALKWKTRLYAWKQDPKEILMG